MIVLLCQMNTTIFVSYKSNIKALSWRHCFINDNELSQYINIDPAVNKTEVEKHVKGSIEERSKLPF